ncbi:MAG: hypothetical protein A2381_10090 [Bdellovibrionales bacterium RIFOXYB1_FULL_37_110]|nr:MAG: hypothetical protein A2417_02605 [Bdellovibrionales bacterium RIFOXYC1_FULL_37_79]OFZ61115.1 MAG: hypothetical protein A2381_10090 [Bdellovibrionales bacterium RIFOXYB1_FULL_37_110]OFZ61606.1 MAG: hypothetical protein A2577_10490 [Bdellovibrionales bacterium RIFOXYD1_FULL_36_51]
MKIIIMLVFLSASLAYAQKFTLSELITQSETHSPLLDPNKAKIDYADQANALATSYYFPVFNFTQRYTESNNPVQAFGMKLMREDFTMQDFALDKLNNPDKTKAHQSSFTLYVPLDVFGNIRTQKKIINHQKESVLFEGQWIKKEIKKNLTALYHAYFSLDDLQKFFISENDFLQKIVRTYDSKSKENKNRYLSYNQARILIDSLQEGIETLTNEKTKLLKEISYISGIEQLELERQSIQNVDIPNLSSRPLARYDLKSMHKYVEALEAEISKEKMAYFPELSAFGQYNLTRENFSDTAGKDTTIGAQLSWTFGLSTVKNVSLSRAKSLQARYEYKNKERRAETEIDLQAKELDKMHKKLRHLENRHKIFSENKNILNFQYQRGSVELYNLLDNFTYYIQNYSDLMKLGAEYQAQLATYVQNFQE